jgi:23S rRNA (adenine2503-C2)-methyltransferase
MRKIKVPTGYIGIIDSHMYNKQLEFVCIGDYGKEKNIKADFLGLYRDINGVPNGDIQPLEEKIVCTISTQLGCSMNCTFCDVPKVGPGINASFEDMQNQVKTALSWYPNLKHTKRLNIHYARMGEPTFNFNVINHAMSLKSKDRGFDLVADTIHPVISTMMPRTNSYITEFLQQWVSVKNFLYNGEAGLQISINSTDEEQRYNIFRGLALRLTDIAKICNNLGGPKGRKYTLNFAIFDDSIIDAKLLADLFDINKFICKITPMHYTTSCNANHLVTTEGYDNYTPYKKIEEELKNVGFDVIVFIPSYDEDNSKITCGNAILSEET